MIYYKAETYPTLKHSGRITPELFVFHSTHGGGFDYLHRLFQGKTTANGGYVTVHFCAYKDGTLVEYAPWKRGQALACWHAGKSYWQGRWSCNYFSIGVEIQHSPYERFTQGQIEALSWLVAQVREEYPHIAWTTHEYISGYHPETGAVIQGKWDPYPPWETQVWPHLKAIIGGEEDTMNKEQEAKLDLIVEQGAKLDRLIKSTAATSYREAIQLAVLCGNWDEADKLAAEAKEKGYTIRGYSRPTNPQ